LIKNIFLVKGNDFQDLENLAVFNYPQDIVTNSNSLIENMLYGHDCKKLQGIENKTVPYQIDEPVPQVINNLNLSTICIDGRIIIGLHLDNNDNPYDYEEIFKELIHELVNNEKICSFEDDLEIENLLITLFIDFRRYGEEVLENFSSPGIEKESSFVKVFLFGIEEVGKTSMVRRIKTGEYSDNYFTPTRKFNIQYVQDHGKGLAAFWDMPGQPLFRKKWLTGLQDSNIVVYMIDISDQIRFESSKKELYSIINRYELSGVPLLIIGNKVDLVNHLSENDGNTNGDHLKRLKNEIFEFFKFNEIRNHEWQFLFTSVKTNYNVDNVVETIFDLLSQ